MFVSSLISVTQSLTYCLNCFFTFSIQNKSIAEYVRHISWAIDKFFDNMELILFINYTNKRVLINSSWGVVIFLIVATLVFDTMI